MKFLFGAVAGAITIGAVSWWILDKKAIVQSAVAYNEGVRYACVNPNACTVEGVR